MGLGVLDDHRLDHVPGTVDVFEQGAPSKSSIKHVGHGPSPIILVPQPSDDPNDPLNWPLWRRDLVIGILCIASVMAAALSPILAANSLTLSLYFRRDFTAIALLTGYHLGGVGVAGALIVASARVWGKRHLYILGCLMLLLTSVWAGASKTYGSLLWARILQGVAVAPFESLVNASVGDLYFVHQRGIRMALTNLALFGSAFFTPIMVGKITHTLGWQWTFYLLAIFGGVIMLLVVLLVPETTYRRPTHLNTDGAGLYTDRFRYRPSYQTEMRALGEDARRRHPGGHEGPSMGDQPGQIGTIGIDGDGNAAVIVPRESYRRSLRLFNGRKTNESFIKLLLRPFPLFLHPAVFWACLIQGALIGWTVLIGVVLAAIFLGPPLFFDEVQTGYMYTGALVGAIVGFFVSGIAADWSARLLTRRNRGRYEPEFRLVLAIPQIICGCAGLYGFGITAAHVDKYGWFWPDFFFGLEVMGMVIGAVCASLYIVDAHRDISVEAFTTLMIFKNIFSFGLTWGAYNWVVQNGIERIFNILGTVQLVIGLLCIPMYILGKRNRSFFHRHDLLQLTGLR